VGNNIDKITHFSSYIRSGVNEVYDTASDQWETKTPMPVSGMRLHANVINDKIFVMGVGLTFVYDTATDSWINKTAMPFSPPTSSASSPSSVAIGNKIIVTGEFSTGILSSEEKVLVYDTETDRWSQGKSGPMIVRDGAVGATSGMAALKRIYVLGLSDEFPPTSANQVYDSKADNWATAKAMPTLRMDFAVTVANDILYAIGGYYISDAILGRVVPTSANEQYTPIGYGSPDPSYVSPVESIPPDTVVFSPANQTYNASSVSLVFTVDKQVNWTEKKT